MMTLALTPGDPDGIGPEITWKALRQAHRSGAKGAILCIGARAPFERLRAPIVTYDPNQPKPPRRKGPFVWLLEAPLPTEPGTHVGGFQSGWAIQEAVRLIREGTCAALVTGPISKEHLQMGGFAYYGHTDFLAKLCDDSQVTMMLANESLRVSLVTTHLPLQSVSARLTPEAIARAADHTIESLRSHWGLRKPRIAVLGLNPHAGEAGLLGREEIQTIAPTIAALRKRWGARAEITGPHPSDTFFAMNFLAKPRDRVDAVVAMYHDQGLIPVKLIDFPNTVNVSLGLPIVRTSVDHGTAFDIAGKNRADPSSMIAAIGLAHRLTRSQRPARKRASPRKSIP